MADAAHVIGQPIDRVDGKLKVTGKAVYSADTPAARPAFGVMVTSTIGQGRIASIDSAKVARAPGILLVMTHENAPKQAAFEPHGADRHARPKPQLVDDRIAYWGQPVALVVGETFEAAQAGARSLTVSYETAPGKYDFEAGRSAAYQPKSLNGGTNPDSKVGNFDTAFDSAATRIDVTYSTPYQCQMPMEPHGSLAFWRGDRLTVHCAAQLVDNAHTSIAATLKLPKERVEVISEFVGGGFGGKLPIFADAILAALAARELKRPVKVLLTRQQMFGVTTHRAASSQRVRLGSGGDGVLAAIGHDAVTQSARADEYTEAAATCTRSLYAGPNRETSHRLVGLDLPIADSMRAPGEAVGLLALEQAIDELAVSLDMDPIELRLKNEPSEDPEKHIPYSTRSLVKCLLDGAARFGWEKRNPKPGSTKDGHWLVGMGVAAAIRPNYLRPAQALVRMDGGGRVDVRMDMTDIGTGSYTIFTQIVADLLGVPMENVTVQLGHSSYPKTPGSGGSFGAASCGAALHDACLKLREAMAHAATTDPKSALRGADPRGLVFAGGRVESQGKSEPLNTLVARSGRTGLAAIGKAAPGDTYKQFSQQSYGAHFVEVGVDEDSGEVRVRRMLGVFGAGRILNAKTARSQLIGGMIWGVSAALHETAELDTRYGGFVNNDLAGYHVPVHADIPDIDAIMVEEFDDKANALGSKGVGELGICGAGAAVANAVYNACGVRVRDYPITVDKVLAGLPTAI